MKELLFRAVASVLYYTGALGPLRLFSERCQLDKKRVAGLSLPWITRRKSKIVQIITHHRVNDDRDPFPGVTPIRAFESQVGYLASHYNVCDANDLKRMLEGNEVPDRAVVITFDDGYRDVYLNAYPVLKKYGVPAMVFLPTGYIGTGGMLWHDQVAHAFRVTQRASVPAYGREGERRALGTQEQRVAAFRATIRFLRTLDEGPRSEWIDQLHRDLGVRRRVDAPALMMTWDEVRTMEKHGISFGSHTVTHPILSRLPPPRVDEEMGESREQIEAELGVPVRVFAFPSGTPADFTEANKDAARLAGYDCAVTSVFGVNRPGDDLFELRRGGPWEQHLPTFAVKLAWYRLSC